MSVRLANSIPGRMSIPPSQFTGALQPGEILLRNSSANYLRPQLLGASQGPLHDPGWENHGERGRIRTCDPCLKAVARNQRLSAVKPPSKSGPITTIGA